MYFDARGEPDLRHPMQSSIVVTTPLPAGQPMSSKHVLFSLHAQSVQLAIDTECHKKVRGAWDAMWDAIGCHEHGHTCSAHITSTGVLDI